MGKITCKIFWVMEEETHRNSINGGTTGAGLRYLLVNRLLRDYQLVYPNNPAAPSVDAFPAYCTMFSISGKVGGVFEASCEFDNSGAPSLC